ncbi:hypothetical protein [Caloranaerobacter sp. DY30410]|uniref:hypothetical protein n=1 Tax=Caloranaerobacter sp. DY30410 TaxID=3238305 RepID=UPI003D04EF26
MVLKKAALRKDVFKSIKLFADEHNMEYEDACDLFYEVVNETVGGNEEATTLGCAIKQHETLECAIKLPDYSSEQPRLTVTITHTIKEE